MAANASDERKASSGDAPSHRAPRLTSARRSVSSVPTRSSRTGSGAGAGAGAGAGTRKARGGIDYGGGSFDGRKQPVSSKIRRRSLGTPLGRVQSMRSMMRGRGQQVPLQVGPRRSATPSLEEQHHSLLQEFLRHAKSADHRGDGDATLEAMGLEELSVSSMVDAVKTASLEHSNQKYTFAIVLKNPRHCKDPVTRKLLRQLQEEFVIALLRMHLELLVLETTPESEDKLIVLVSAVRGIDNTDPSRFELLHQVHYQIDVERYLSFGMGSQAEPVPIEERPQPTTAMQIFLTNSLIERAEHLAYSNPTFEANTNEVTERMYQAKLLRLGRQTCGKVKVKCDVPKFKLVEATFALHDQAKNDQLMKRFWNRKFVDFFDLAKEINIFNEHFGPRIAFYFAFINTYTKSLLPLAACVVPYYLIFRLATWAWYVRTLAIVGLFVPVVWGPVWLNRWKAHSEELAFDWNIASLPDTEHVLNRDSKGEPVVGEVVHDKDGVVFVDYDHKRNRRKVQLCMIPFAILNIVVLICGLTPFMQWYAYGKLSPTCECCNWYLDSTPAQRANYTGKCEMYLVNEGELGYKPPDSCVYFVSCFDSVTNIITTDRWTYILIQGIILGIVLDVVQFEIFRIFTLKLTHVENWQYEAEFERRLIRKRFAFLWGNMYFCFFFVAFAYVPFGAMIQEFLLAVGLDFAVPGHGWRDGIINIDEAFVTPLIATQSLNLAIETFVPWLVARGMLKAQRLKRRLNTQVTIKGLAKNLRATASQITSKVRHASRASATKDLLPGLEQHVATREADMARRVSHQWKESTSSRESGAKKAFGVSGPESTVSRIDVEAAMPESFAMSDLHTPETLVSAVQHSWKSLGNGGEVSLPLQVAKTSLDSNHLTATEVVLEASKGEFHPRDDYLDMLMQFGYVCMFTTVWALAPVPAFINNVLEIRGDTFKLFYSTRRPVPAMDPGIGEWYHQFHRSAQWAIPVVVALIMLTTGEAEFWGFGACLVASEETEIMGPNMDCFGDWGFRLGIAILLEHFFLGIQAWVRRSQQFTSHTLEIKRLRRRRQLLGDMKNRFLPSLDKEFADDLRVVYHWFDVNGDGFLGHDESRLMFRALIASSPDPAKRKRAHLAERHFNALFDFLDQDHSDSINFHEIAMAIRCAEVDPYLATMFSSEQLEDCCHALASRIRQGSLAPRVVDETQLSAAEWLTRLHDDAAGGVSHSPSPVSIAPKEDMPQPAL